MHVIFLDIDGVLNSEAYALKLEEKHRQLGHTEPASPKRETTCDCFKLYHQIDRDAVARLNRLVAATDAKIVISSTWRKLFDPPDLERVLIEHDLVAEIIGATPDGHAEPEMSTVYGPIERMYRGYEIDFWLRQHPEVDRFVILDDGSDMVMHKNRLVQTDCQEGLLDDHAELAIRVMAWDGKTEPSPMDELEAKALVGPRLDDEDEDEDDNNDETFMFQKDVVSTRSNTNADARRDFDGFSVDEELRRLRIALRNGRWRIAAELAANLDEHLCRGGSLPVAWLGPACMQEDADLDARLRPTMEAAANMSTQQRQEVIEGYVAVAPPPVTPPGSSWGHHCHEAGCVETLTVSRTTAAPPSDEDDYQHFSPALTEAAVFLGWRLHGCVWWCPTHVIAKLLACARCLSPCPECSCMGGPRSEAIDGMIVDVTETKA